jgi:Tol biopolymer transport system component
MNAARWTRIGPLKVVLAGAFLAATLVALLLTIFAAEQPAQAAFPGKNGKIAFTKVSENNFYEIFTMNPGGSNQTNITNTGEAHEYQPAWSPDGTKIAFPSESTTPPSNLDIYTMAADGSDRINITNTSLVGDNESHPT